MSEVRKFFLAVFGLAALIGLYWYLTNKASVDHTVGNGVTNGVAAFIALLILLGKIALGILAVALLLALAYGIFRFRHHAKREQAKTRKHIAEAEQAEETASIVRGDAQQKQALALRESRMTVYLLEREALTNDSLSLDLQKKTLALPYMAYQEGQWVHNLRTGDHFDHYRRTVREVPPEEAVAAATPRKALPPVEIEIPTFREAWEDGLIAEDQPDALLCFKLLEEAETRQVQGFTPIRGLLEENSTMLICGDTKSGKSTDMAVLGGQYAAMGALLALVDPHLSHPERSLAHKLAALRASFLCEPASDEPKEIARLYRLLKEEADLRKYKGESRYDWRPIVLLIDEILALMLVARISTSEYVRRLYYNFAIFLLEMTTQYAKFGISGIFASQYVTKGEFTIRCKGLPPIDFRDGCVTQTAFALPGNQAAALQRIDRSVKVYIPGLPSGFGYSSMPGLGTMRIAIPNLLPGDLDLLVPAVAAHNPPRTQSGPYPVGFQSREDPLSTSGEEVTPERDTQALTDTLDEIDVNEPVEPSGPGPERVLDGSQDFKKVFTAEQELEFLERYSQHPAIKPVLRLMKVGNDYAAYASHLVETRRLRKSERSMS